jgi:hypothetical protein
MASLSIGTGCPLHAGLSHDTRCVTPRQQRNLVCVGRAHSRVGATRTTPAAVVGPTHGALNARPGVAPAEKTVLSWVAAHYQTTFGNGGWRHAAPRRWCQPWRPGIRLVA